MISFQNISIKNKLIFIQVATATLAVLICSVIFVYNDIMTFKESSAENKYSIAEIVGENSIAPLEFNDQVAANEILLQFKTNSSILNAVILDKNGNEFARFDKKGEELYDFTVPTEKTVMTDRLLDQEFIVSYKIFQNKEFIGTVLLRSQIIDFNAIILKYITTAILVLILSVLLALLISNLLQRIITRPLLSLVAKTREVTVTGNYSIRAPVSGTDEIAVLSEAFNNMLSQIERAERTLKEINTQLEQRVKERTLELETVNKSLLEKSEELGASNQELEQFAYVASHDLQEPLRTITNFVGLLAKKYSIQTDKDTEIYFKFILTATSKMRSLIKDLLEFSRVGRNISFSQVDCNEVLNETINELSLAIQESNAKITSSHLPVVPGNKIELKRLFLNLFTNALKFRSKERTPEISVTADEKETEYVFAFKDNGIGIEEEYISKLFVIFQRLNRAEEYPGTGIGLATCKKIVNIHNGRIWIESKWGEGTDFYFTLPKEI